MTSVRGQALLTNWSLAEDSRHLRGRSQWGREVGGLAGWLAGWLDQPQLVPPLPPVMIEAGLIQSIPLDKGVAVAVASAVLAIHAAAGDKLLQAAAAVAAGAVWVSGWVGG